MPTAAMEGRPPKRSRTVEVDSASEASTMEAVTTEELAMEGLVEAALMNREQISELRGIIQCLVELNPNLPHRERLAKRLEDLRQEDPYFYDRIFESFDVHGTDGGRRAR